MQLVLYEPEIPPNAGNVARLSAAAGVPLHFIEPLGFSLADKYLKRAGLDYWPHVDLAVWPDWEAFVASPAGQGRMVLTSSRRGTPYHEFAFQPGDTLVFGPETRGLPDSLFDRYEHAVNIPIRNVVRSINLSTAAGILLYEALRRSGGLDDFTA